MRFSVLSYNIHKGLNSTNLYALSEIRSAIRESQADLVFLQEVSGHDVDLNAPQFEFLADEVWSHYAYGKNSVYSQGHHGNVILSKYPITSWENIDVSTNPLEKRGILHAVIDVAPLQKKMHAICLHLNLLGSGRRTQILHLCDRVKNAVPDHEPLIVAGDFNDWDQALSPILLEGVGLREAFFSLHGEHARTFPSWMPFLRLDRIYYRGFAPVRAERMEERERGKLSDHRAIYAELALEPRLIPGAT